MDQAVVIRPRRLAVVAAVVSAVLVIGTVAGWVALPANLQATFTVFQVLTLLGLLAVLLLVMLAMGTSYVRADAAGLRFRNGLRTHTVPWSRVHKILLRPGDPWAMVLLRPTDGSPFVADLDAERVQLMAVQTGDGERARQALRELEGRRPSG